MSSINIEQVREKVVELIHEKTGIENDRLTDEATLRNELAIDSLDLMDILLELEKVYNIKIEDEDAERLTTVGDICSLIQKLAA
jgi:acyl carrier protein